MWQKPLDLSFVITCHSMSFLTYPDGITGIPVGNHPGAFQFKRKNHTHEGVDLYCPDATPVKAVEDGVVVAILDFTGEQAHSPWWNDTHCVMVEGASGVVLYGEINPDATLVQGQSITAGQQLGTVKQVLRVNKGRPQSMLHLELHTPGTRNFEAWEGEKPQTLLDPTPLLRPLAVNYI